MSSKDIRKYILDIIEAAQDIEQFVSGKTFEDYSSDILIKAAVERKFEIIGEALNRIQRWSPDTVEQIRNYRKIIAFRNILAHGYDIVSDPIVWDIVESNLDQLLEDAKTLQQ